MGRHPARYEDLAIIRLIQSKLSLVQLESREHLFFLVFFLKDNLENYHELVPNKAP